MPQNPQTGQEATKILHLCADDYGLSPGVNAAILDLLTLRRLSATSCMTVYPDWAESAAALRPFRATADIGLHITLTDDRPLGALMKAAYRRQLDLPAIRARIDQQYDNFCREMGGPPDFLDGHQHVHLFPGIREIVLDLYDRQLQGSGAWIRSCSNGYWGLLTQPKALLLSVLSAPLTRQLRARGIPTNDGFGGVYDFAPTPAYADLFQGFLKQTGPRPLIMCHPGGIDPILAERDGLLAARETEYAYFRSPDFIAHLEAAGKRLARS
jgi:chitin disaccharide deacetylase